MHAVIYEFGPSTGQPLRPRRTCDFYIAIGVDAVGMSTVPEVTVAHHAVTRVLGISGISNKANLDGNTFTTHEEVLEAGQKIVPQLITLIQDMIARL